MLVCTGGRESTREKPLGSAIQKPLWNVLERKSQKRAREKEPETPLERVKVVLA